MVHPSLYLCRVYRSAHGLPAAVPGICGYGAVAMTRLKSWCAAIVAALAILASAYVKGRSDKDADATKDRLQAVNKARKIEDETSRLSDRDVDARLGKWLRD